MPIHFRPIGLQQCIFTLTLCISTMRNYGRWVAISVNKSNSGTDAVQYIAESFPFSFYILLSMIAVSRWQVKWAVWWLGFEARYISYDSEETNGFRKGGWREEGGGGFGRRTQCSWSLNILTWKRYVWLVGCVWLADGRGATVGYFVKEVIECA